MVLRGEHGFTVLISHEFDDGERVLLPMEASWFLASPLVGGRVTALVEDLFRWSREHASAWDAMVLAGIPEGGQLFRALLKTFTRRYSLFKGMGTVRRLANLTGGRQAYLARRSAKFRKNLRRAIRRARDQNISFSEPTADCAEVGWSALFERLMDIEARGWKGRTDQGINRGAMRRFYAELMARQGPRGEIRCMMAHQEEREVGYILGGVQNGIYRGYQFSYDQDFKHLSLGNLLQWYTIESLCREGVGCYDLGMDMPYKLRWSDGAFETTAMIIRNS
jgi:hypothetical protein